MRGKRKMVLGFAYLACCMGIAWMAVSASWDPLGAASMFASMATGVGVVVWGNVEEHRAVNGG